MLKTMALVFGQKFNFGTHSISLERACQEEQNGANFSFVALSSEE